MTDPSDPTGSSGSDPSPTSWADRPAPISRPLSEQAAHPPSVQWDDGSGQPAAATATVTAPQHRSTKKQQKPERSSLRSTVEWAAVIVGALVVALVVKTFLFQAFYIPSASMEPTLKKGDRVLVNKVSYDVHDIHRGDIVVFELPKDKIGPDGIKDLIKRVIALPGETISSDEAGAVYIDGKLLDEPYLPDGVTTAKPRIDPPVTVPAGHIFVMGDNRDNSADSRYANRGPIPIDTVVGRAFVQVWPPTGVGGL